MKGIFIFDPADEIYKDHFPACPVVPGSMIVNAFMEAGRKNGLAGPSCGIANFKFRRFISPGNYPYCMEPVRDGIKCFLYEDGDVVASGKIANEA